MNLAWKEFAKNFNKPLLLPKSFSLQKMLIRYCHIYEKWDLLHLNEYFEIKTKR